LTEWTDPMVFVGGAQIFMAFVLALFTAFLWWSTNKYAKITEEDLKLKEKNRRIERLHKELDNIIGPIYSKLGYDSKLPDKNYFNNAKIWGSMPLTQPMDDIGKATYIALEFWRGIKKNMYLTTDETRKKIKPYLELKVGTRTWQTETDDGYRQDLKDITNAVEDRYKKLTVELDELENNT
jgi:hypothetical protein